MADSLKLDSAVASVSITLEAGMAAPPPDIGPPPPLEIAFQSAVLAAVPAAVMLLGSLATVLSPSPPPKVAAHALQHLAAGIMLCAISMELVPPLVKARSTESIVGLLIGFILGVTVMLGMSQFLEGDEEEGDAGSEVQDEQEPLLSAAATEEQMEDGRNTRMSEITPATDREVGGPTKSSTSRDGSAEDGVTPKRHTSKVNEAYAIASETASEAKVPFPAAFALAVYIDSALDGMLVGLALVTGHSAGVFMATAMAVEMGFLGLTFAAACTSQPRALAVPAVVTGPVVLMIGSAIGGLAANSLATHEPALVGCTAFGVAALLYMVCEELLVSAHEEGEEHVWWVDLQVFVGFVLALLVEKFIS